MTFSGQQIAIIVLVVFFVVFLGVSVLRISSVERVPQGTVLTLTGPAGDRISLSVEIADDAEERRTGLMFREVLPAGTGMLFVFEREDGLSFWMKNTLIPLDVLFFDSAGQFVSRSSMVPCDGDPCPLTPAGGPSRYALEVNRGEPKTAEVGEGWMLRMDPPSLPRSYGGASNG